MTFGVPGTPYLVADVAYWVEMYDDVGFRQLTVNGGWLEAPISYYIVWEAYSSGYTYI